MSDPVLKIRRLDNGKYTAAVGKTTKMFDTLLDAVQWAENRMTYPKEETNNDQGTTEKLPKYQARA